jgi:hypothetical protein
MFARQRFSACRNLEIVVIVVPAFGIKLCATELAPRLALQILVDCQPGTAGAAKYCLLVPFAHRPDLDCVIGECGVAVVTRIVNATAFHLDRHNVGRPVVMFAAGFRTKIYAAHCWKIRNHHRSEKPKNSTNGHQFLVEPADLTDAIHKVNLKYPMPLSAGSVWRPHSVVVLGMNIKRDLIPRDFLVGEHPDQMAGNGATVLPSRLLCQLLCVAVELSASDRWVFVEILLPFAEPRLDVAAQLLLQRIVSPM